MNGEQLLKEAEGFRDRIIENRRYLHRHAEVGFELTNTLAYVKKELEEMGYEPQECGRAGLVVLAGGKKPGKVFMIRGDMDALPFKEEADVDFASETCNMHACGHDMHTAMMLGAARLLKAHEDDIEGTVKLMFQPSEETFEGSHDMIQAGVLENPKVDGALMIHVMAGMPFTAGTVIVTDGGTSAPGADYFTINVKGKGCHGSMPNAGVDPINIAAHIVTALQEINSRELALVDEAVLTIGKIAGGKAGNAIADTVEMVGTIRTYDEEVRVFVKRRLEEISSGIAAAFRGSASVEWGSGCPCLINDKEVSKSVAKYMQELLGPGRSFTTGQLAAMSEGKANKSAGSEDFAYISQEVPSVMIALAAGEPAKGYKYPQHHPMVKFDEAALASGSAVYAYAATRWLEEHR